MQIAMHPLKVSMSDGKLPLLFRTDFSSDRTWNRIYRSTINPDSEYQMSPNMEFINLPKYDGFNQKEIKSELPADYPHPFFAMADQQTMKSDPPLLLIVAMDESTPFSFRCSCFDLWFIDNNLSTGNLSFEEISFSLDNAGLFSFSAFRTSQISK